ncbi:DUF3987 domain-containing protein [Winogradskyella sp. F6397]|uniref:DUF3987 domain-containing protein n=1 Tax=Winogradskyella marina TaxID=2785530 RepID=A0ABS0EF32_9FLAO|nr:DUF3987 domain-containing protein [Winogradskyella marina]MBF8149063.1 DUF3987 domain-containing protein [Winogradskyella marina]
MERRLIEKHIYNRLPEELITLTEQFESREKDIVLLSSLGVLSSCLPSVNGIYDGDFVYPHLYLMVIAPAASGKGVMNYSRLLIEPIHDKIFNESKSQFLICEESNKNKKSESDKCPDIKVKILPANISSAEMHSFLDSSKHGLLIMESEADTLSNMLKNDWSNFSDVLRKAFHHEPVSVSRKTDKVFVDIKEPKLSMVISGTPDQLKPLIKSRENGLFSRFMIYNFDEITDFKDVFAAKTKNNKVVFDEVGKDIFNLYGELVKLENPIEFSFTDQQKEKFLSIIRPIRTDIVNNHSQSFISNLHRHGLILFRIAMILTVLRNKSNIKKESKLFCSNNDFLVASQLMKTLLRHCQFTFNSIETGDLSLQDENILDDLKSIFTRQEAIDVGVKFGIPTRTIDDKLVQWKKRKYIFKQSRGKYKKRM